MKTSNYISISFFVFLFGGVFLLFLSSKFHPWEVAKPELETVEESLGDFKVVVVTNHSNIRIRSSEHNKIVAYSRTADSLKKPVYLVRNDTLFINQTPSEISPEIFCRKISSIVVADKSKVHLNKMPIDTLDIALSSGKFYCVADKKKNSVRLLNVNADSDSYIQLNQMNIDALNINLDHANVNIQNTTIASLSGSLTNGSKLNCYKSIGKMNLDVDLSSKYNLSK